MSTKEKIKKEIDHISDDILDDVLKYLYALKNNINQKDQIESVDKLISTNSDLQNGLSEFQEFLLSAPVMPDEDYNYFLEKKQSFNKWK